MTPRSRVDWVVMGDSAKLEDGKCLRCGETFYVQKPVNLEVWCAAANAFVKIHRRCFKRAETRAVP